MRATTLPDGTPAMQILENAKEAVTVKDFLVSQKTAILVELERQAAERSTRRDAQKSTHLAEDTAWMMDHGHVVLERSGSYESDLQIATLVDMTVKELAGDAEWYLASRPLRHSAAPDPVRLDCRVARNHLVLTAIMTRCADGVTTASEGGYWLLSDSDVAAIRNAVSTMESENAEKVRFTRSARARRVIAQVQRKGGPEKLMTAEQIAIWRRQYNDVANEGSEGYIPEKVNRWRAQTHSRWDPITPDAFDTPPMLSDRHPAS